MLNYRWDQIWRSERGFPRRYDKTSDTGESASPTPRGRSPGCLYTTTREVATGMNLLSLIDPLPLDQLSRHTVAAICSWPAVDRHHILAVANRDVRVARQNLAELQLYVDDHAAHLANCASADDDEIALMSAELLPRLEGGIRAALDEADTDGDIQTFIVNM